MIIIWYFTIAVFYAYDAVRTNNLCIKYVSLLLPVCVMQHEFIEEPHGRIEAEGAITKAESLEGELVVK